MGAAGERPHFAAGQTRRQALRALLQQGPWGFEALREALEVPVRQLEDDLRHVAKSARGAGGRLEVDPARCHDCDFVFRGREARHYHAPGRCPLCRSRRIEEPRLWLAPRGRGAGAREGEGA